MSLQFAGRITDVRTSSKFPTVTFIIKNGDKTQQVILTKPQLESKAGVVRAHSLRGATLRGEFYAAGENIPTGRDTSIIQTQERLDLGRGVKDFSLELNDVQDMKQGQLEMYGNAVTKMFMASTAAAPTAAPAPNTVTEAPAQDNAPVEEQPALAALAAETEA